MSLTAGQQIALDIEKPVAGGRMIARHDGQVILVLGAIPGERVRATIERVEKRLAFATATEVLVPSPDRRGDARDPRCGGCLYAHVAYPRQLRMKAEVVADAFVRLGRIPLAEPVPVAPSPEHGYRIRARLHVRGGRLGLLPRGHPRLVRCGGDRSARPWDARRGGGRRSGPGRRRSGGTVARNQ